MAILREEKKMYGARNKNEFLLTVNNSKWYEWFFDKTFDYEHRNSKDLYDFNKNELLDFLKDQKLSYSTLSVNKSYISSYINWAIEKGLKLNKNNTALEIKTEELKNIAIKNTVIHYERIYEIIGHPDITKSPLKNYQDILLIYLIFLGIRGDRAKELLNLKWEHIDFENKILKLSEIDPNRKDRDMSNDEFLIEALTNAQIEKHYDRYMDESNAYTTNTRVSYELVESEYVFRKTTLGHNTGTGKMTYQGISRRLQSISKHVGESLTMNKIERAGMTFIGKIVLDNKLPLTADNPVVIKSIFERYNITDEEQAKWAVIRKLKKDIKETYIDQS